MKSRTRTNERDIQRGDRRSHFHEPVVWHVSAATTFRVAAQLRLELVAVPLVR